MINSTPLKKVPSLSVAIQNLSFEQNIYLKNKKVQEQHGDLVCLIYDMQNWPLFQKEELSFDQRIEKMNQWFGAYAIKKKMREKGDVYIWLVDVNGTIYSLYLCSYAFFMETKKSTDFEKVLVDVREIATLMFKDAKAKPRNLKLKKSTT